MDVYILAKLSVVTIIDYQNHLGHNLIDFYRPIKFSIDFIILSKLRVLLVLFSKLFTVVIISTKLLA